MNNDDLLFLIDPLKEVISDDRAIDEVFAQISKEPEYLEALTKYEFEQINQAEFIEIIKKLLLKS